MIRAIATRPVAYLRKPTTADGREFVAGVRASQHLLPFVHAADRIAAYRAWLARGTRPDTEQFLVCLRSDDTIAGFVNLNNITLGSLQSASMGWAAFAPHVGRGLLSDGVDMVLEIAFSQLQLHRVEANIQPANSRSRALAVRCGFSLEGFSPRFLRIGGEWCDHERWAVLADDWRARQRR